MNMDDLIQKIRTSAQQITLPKIYLQLKELLADPHHTMAEVALLINRDPVLAMRFLLITNSPLNNQTAKIERIGRAISLLNTQQIHDIILCASVAEAFDGIINDTFDMKQFWQRSVYCAFTARQLATECGVKCEQPFLLGLLADIGHLFMYLGIPEQSQQAILQATREQKALYLVEREQFGFDYAAIGGMMMKEWSLSKSLQIPITFHTEPNQVRLYTFESGLLHIASLLVQADLEAGEFGEGVYAVNQNALKMTGLTLERCLEARDIATKQLKSSLRVF